MEQCESGEARTAPARSGRGSRRDGPDERAAAARGDDDAVSAAVFSTRIAAALGTLPIEQRATIELAYCHGYRLSEIAEITGCPVGTVKTRMFDARSTLRSVLGDEQ